MFPVTLGKSNHIQDEPQSGVFNIRGDGLVGQMKGNVLVVVSDEIVRKRGSR
jgi:hypothetical protein